MRHGCRVRSGKVINKFKEGDNLKRGGEKGEGGGGGGERLRFKLLRDMFDADEAEQSA